MMPISTTGKLNKEAGFTLIELILVVLLLGLMASLSLPVISSYDPDQLNSTARRLSGTVKYLYNEAAMTGREHRLIFEIENSRYLAKEVTSAGEVQPLKGIGAEHLLGEGVRFKSIYQPGKGEQKSGKVTTAMLPGGWLQETIIYLQDDEQRKLTLRLAPLTGITEIYAGFKDFR